MLPLYGLRSRPGGDCTAACTWAGYTPPHRLRNGRWLVQQQLHLESELCVDNMVFDGPPI